MKFIHEEFLLQTRTARRLYHQFAEAEPIFDYHCHLSPRDIAENRQFKNLFEIWLEGDHYKWRAMRANGVAEKFCTGDAEPYDKFRAWAATVPHTLRNPLYHWTHLELKRYFGIDELLDEASAARIWKKANEQLATPALTTQGILKKFKVKVVCTTDDPADDLEHHQSIAASTACHARVARVSPGQGAGGRSAGHFNHWVERLAAGGRRGHRQLRRLPRRAAPAPRLFPLAGLPAFRPRPEPLLRRFLLGENRRRRFLTRRAAAKPASPEEQAQFATFLMLFFGQLDAEKAGPNNCTSARCATTTRAC